MEGEGGKVSPNTILQIIESSAFPLPPIFHYFRYFISFPDIKFPCAVSGGWSGHASQVTRRSIVRKFNQLFKVTVSLYTLFICPLPSTALFLRRPLF